MSAKLVPPATSPSMANLASKVISRLASHHMADDESESDITTTTTTTTTTSPHINNQDDEDDDEDAGIIRCICNYTDDDGFTIQCEHCLVWQHAVCVGIVQSNVPDRYLCEQCSPRPVDRKRANEVQRRRIGALDRKREKTPPPPPPSRRKTTSAASSSSSKQSSNKESSSHATHANSSTSVQSGKGSLPNTDARKGKGANKTPSSHLSSNQQGHPSLPSTTATLSSPQTTPTSTKQKGGSQSNSYRSSSRTRAEDEDLEMESDNSQEDLLDSYQFEFSSVEMNIVTSKAVQDLFRMTISQFRQAQSRKRSLSITSGVKLQELVASASANDTPTLIPESPDSSSTTLGTLPPPPVVDTTNLVSMERESLARPLMKATVKHIISSSKAHHSPAPQYGLFAESSIGAGRFMMEFKGEVSLKSTYKSDPINQYSILATPKPFVLFHPHLDLVVDARRSGNDARFVRRSCFPNTEVKSIVVPGVQDQTVHLGLFAKVPIGKGQEITLDWDWKRDHPALQPLKSDKSKDSNRKSSKEIRKAKFMVASTLLAQTDCACDNKDVCVLHQMMKDGMSEPSPRDNDTSTKGNRPKKTASESLRQRYGNHRDRSRESESGKRSADQDSSNEEELSVTETTRRKSPKAIKIESSSKKARHREGHAHYRAEQEQGSESDSDDHRRRKQAVGERSEASWSRTNQGLSSREMKQAMIQISKLEDKDSSKLKAQGSITKGSALPSPSKDSISSSRRSGASPPPRREKNPSVDSNIRSNSPSKKLAMEEDNISIGDSGIDSDSNGPGRDTFNTALSGNKRLFNVQSQGKRYRDQIENDTMSQSSLASDSDRRDDNPRHSKGSSPSRSGKRPYSAASRGKRIAETLGHKQSLSSKDKLEKQASGPERHVSGSSSVESSFVSIVGNTSDEEEEYIQKTDRQALREKNLPKETLPAASLKPSMLPCKKVWKMIYMKQRALAEEEALEKAEEMRKKAEEVFDLKMEEEDPTNVQPPRDSVGSVLKDGVEEDSVPKVKPEPEVDVTDQPTIVHEDILNLFHEDVRPEPSGPLPGKDTKDIQMASPPLSGSSKPTVEQPVIAAPTVVSDIFIASAQVNITDTKKVPEVIEVIEAKDAKDFNPPQKMSLDSYQAKRKVSRSPALAESTDIPSSEPAAMSVEPRQEDVEMTEVEPETINALVPVPDGNTESEVETVVETRSTEAPVVEAISVPKVKLSLQEYQKQRQVASQRVVNPGSELPPAKNKINDTDVAEAGSVLESSAQNKELVASDVEMRVGDTVDDAVRAMPLVEAGAVPNEPTRGDYFDVGTSLPTPLIGLSSRAQAGMPGDYFPVQPFSPISLSAGPTPFSKLNLTSSPPRTTSDAPTRSPAKSPVRSHVSSSPKDQDVRSGRPGLGSSPPPSTQGSAGWRTPRSQQGTSPQPGGQGPSPSSYRNGEPRPAESRSNDGRLTSPRYHGSPSSDRAPPTGVPLGSPTRERQHSLTSGVLPTSPYEGTGGGHYGYDDPSFKRSGPMSSPTGPPLGSRDYYKGDERARHRSMNGDEWGYNSVDQAGYGGYRGLRGAPPPPPRDRERDRDREHDRDRERDRRDRYDRRDYFMNGSMSGGGNTGGGNLPGYYGLNRGASTGGPGPGGPGLYGRRPSDYYNQGGRDEGFTKNTGNGNTAFDGGNNSNNAGVP